MPLEWPGKTDDAPPRAVPKSAKDEGHMQKYNLSLNVKAVCHARQLLRQWESLQLVLIVSSPTAWGNEKFVQSGFHKCSTMTKEPCVFLPTPICGFGEKWQYISGSYLNG